MLRAWGNAVKGSGMENWTHMLGQLSDGVMDLEMEEWAQVLRAWSGVKDRGMGTWAKGHERGDRGVVSWAKGWRNSLRV